MEFPQQTNITSLDFSSKLTMAGEGPNEGIDEMDCSSFFDHIEDLLDFPADEIDTGLSSNLDSFPSIWSAQSESLPCSDSVFSNNATSDLSAELSVSYEDIVQLEWLSTFVEDSFSGGSFTMKKPDDVVHNKGLFHTPSPVSVLESSISYYSGDKTAPRCPDPSLGKRGRARSKRPRPATFNPRPAMHLMSPSGNSFPPQGAGSSDSENYGESRPVMIKIAKKELPKGGGGEEKKKKKKIKFTVSHGLVEASPSQDQPREAIRKCLHCEITKTPQWRAGPLGPKTLCNACGVRYKSGRLFPEYRPAASPTFIPAVHSNSHKKVIEMRTKMGDSTDPTPAAELTAASPPELIPNTKVQLDYML